MADKLGGGGGWKEKRGGRNTLRNGDFFVRYQPIRFYGFQDGFDSDWLIFKTNNFNSIPAPQDV